MDSMREYLSPKEIAKMRKNHRYEQVAVSLYFFVFGALTYMVVSNYL